MHTWTETNKGRMLKLNGDGAYCVKVEATDKGFLWVAGRKMGYAPSVRAACDMTEALFENDELAGPWRPVKTGNRKPKARPE